MIKRNKGCGVTTLANKSAIKSTPQNEQLADELHKPIIDVKDNTYIDFGKEVNDNDPKFKVVDHVRISKYKNIFAKIYTPSWSEEIFVIKKIKNTVPWTYVINDLNGKEIIGIFYGNKLQRINQEEFRI